MRVLELGNNGMVELPDSLSIMVNLECLNLQGNSFPKLPQVRMSGRSCVMLSCADGHQTCYPFLATLECICNGYTTNPFTGNGKFQDAA